jgi:predicted SAM-dependent methyltransferase
MREVMNRFNNLLKKIFPYRFLKQLKLSVRKIRYSGKRYECPICNSQVRNWKPLGYDLPVIKEKQIVGGGYRLAMCPVCESSDRVRLLYIFLKNRTQIFTKHIKLIHIAPEPPLEFIFKNHKNIDYLTADLDPEAVMKQMDITNIQFSDQTFDAIICNHVLEHIPDDQKAIQELFRVLKPGCWAILQVPFSKILDKTFEDPSVTTSEDREGIFGQSDHVRIYGKDYSERLKQAGFEVEIYKWTEDKELNNPNNYLGLNEDEVVFYCQKK